MQCPCRLLCRTMSSQARDIVRQRNAEFEKFFHDSKFDDLANLYTDDAKLMPFGHEIVVGRQAIKEYFAELRKDGTIKPTAEEVIELGNDTILDRGKWLFLNGEDLLDEGKYVVIYKKVDGKYLAFIDIDNSNRRS